MAERRYDDKEVGRILSRAQSIPSGGEGVTREELVRIATEVGLDPASVERAADELDDASRPRTNAALLERTIEGELTDEAWERLVTEAQAFTGTTGTVEGREWRGGSELESFSLNASTRNGRTRLKLIGDASGAHALLVSFGGVFGLFAPLIPLIVNTKTGHPWGWDFVLLASILIVVGTIFGVREIAFSRRRRFTHRVQGLMDRLVATVPAQDLRTQLGSLGSIESPVVDGGQTLNT